MEILRASSIDPSPTNAKKGNKYEASENLTALKEYIEGWAIYFTNHRPLSLKYLISFYL